MAEPFIFNTQAEWDAHQRRKAKRPPAEVDTECYPDWWLFKIWLPDGQQYSIDMHAGKPLAVDAIQWFADNFTWYTFNGDNYDEPMITLAMSGADNWQLKQANDRIITGGLKRWDFYRAYGLERIRNLDHVDVMEVAPGVRVGLKTYAGRMHSRKMQDLPYNPNEPTTWPMRVNLDTYCSNDLQVTRDLRTTVAKRLQLREAMGERYGVDLRSKSDAQMAEAIIKARLPFIPEKRQILHGFTFQYEPAPFIRFSTPELQQAYELIKRAVFTVNDVDQLRTAPGEEVYDTDGKKIKTGIIMPPELKALVITIGGNQYQLGIGGLHSKESAVQYHGPGLRMDDVASYYPSLILNLGIEPAQLAGHLQPIYRAIYNERLDAKAKVKKGIVIAVIDGVEISLVAIDGGFKIVLNGTFGKLGSKYSIMYAPEQLIKVTLTGQLALLMLIESLHLAGVQTASANTDGLVTLCPPGREWLRDSCIKYWAATTGLTMESDDIAHLYARDVNNYLAIWPNGEHKGKGIFAASGVDNNVHPEKDIVADAVIAYLKHGTPLAQTIRACNDIRQFLVIRSVKGGGVYNAGADADCVGADEPTYLGKTVRWYYAAGETRAIHYKTRGNKVAGSTGARPLMELPDTMPSDVDYAFYEADAVKMLASVGVAYVPA